MRYVTKYGAPVLSITLWVLGLSACGSSSSLPDYSLGGMVNGLQAGKSLVLQNNGAGELTVAQSGDFTFPTGFAPGSSYAVTVLTQPAGQTCSIVNGSGELPGAVSVLAAPAAHGVSNIIVNCSAGAGPFTVSGTIAGLLPGNSIVLQDNGGNDATVSANGGFVFSTALVSGTAYAVTVLTRPPGQNCSISNGSGAAILANVSNIAVVCSDDTFNIAAAVSGLVANDSLVVQLNGADNLTVSVNGTANFNAPIPSGSSYAVTILTQPTGETCTVTNGSGTVAAANVTNVSIACTTTPTTAGLWTWESGSHVYGAAGVYGTLGTPAPGNVPGARSGLASWIDAANNLWLFGGVATSGSFGGGLNDLWEYNQTTGLWTWQSGSSNQNVPGNYGTQGVPAPTNVPGARYYSVSWTDSAGNFWLFGGTPSYPGGVFSGGSRLNDLWRYTPSTGLWTWMSGSASTNVNSPNAAGVYGTQGAAAAGNTPGARNGSVTWTDKAGNLWLFGGDGQDGVPGQTIGQLNDLWRYNTSTGLWTWVGGSNSRDATGVYGTLGIAAAGNLPGARSNSVSWTDSGGNFWLFGGSGWDSSPGDGAGYLNDLWRYSPTTGQWTWMSGSDVTGASAVFGTKGTGALGNTPWSMYNALSWADSAGNLWLFGGTNVFGDLDDLWEYRPSTGLWTWIGGSNGQDQSGVYGTLGVAAPFNIPGARDSSTTWVDGAGNFWLFGGNAFAGGNLYPGYVNDLWKYVPPGP
jgi:hypothetical protein